MKHVFAVLIVALWLLVAQLFAHTEAPHTSAFIALDVVPEEVVLEGRFAYVQLITMGSTADGTASDLTRDVQATGAEEHLSIDPRGLVRPIADGSGELFLRVDDLEVRVPYRVSGMDETPEPRFLTDVMPVISRSGCNTGSCHGSADGQNGFQLSLRGYDPLFDHGSLTDDLGARRFDRVAPGSSLFLLKPIGRVPHVGGQALVPDSHDHALLEAWTERGAPYEPDAARVASIELLPKDPVLQHVGDRQQVAVWATLSDGTRRDVSAHAFVETSDIEITDIDAHGLVTGLRRGESAILARYEGQYAATRLLVMGDREGWTWSAPPVHNGIDAHVYAKLEAIRSEAAPLCTDAEFVRRVHLDLTGTIPTARATRQFLDDRRDTRVKREELIERLLGSPDYVDYWTNKWCDLLQVNSGLIGDEGARRFHDWVQSAVVSNAPYDGFVRDILTATGSTLTNPPANFFKVHREPDLAMETTTQLFLGIRFNCNKCHDHPFERWTQKDHWQLAGLFAQVKREEAAGPSEEIISDADTGDVTFPETDVVAEPAFPFEHEGAAPAGGTRREELSAWLTAPENPYFAKSYVNRVWSYFMGRGIIEPVDDIRAGNPASHPELLEELTEEFIASGFDTRSLMRKICQSRVYQHSVATTRWNEQDDRNYSHALARRLPAEVLFDAVHRASGSELRLPGQRRGTRAMQLVDGSVSSEDGFLEVFGRPARQSACECERGTGVTIGQALSLVNGPTVANALRDEDGGIAELVRIERDPAGIIDELFVSFLSRPPSAAEAGAFLPNLDPFALENRVALGPEGEAQAVAEQAAWEATVPPLPDWQILDRATAFSAGGARLVVETDGTVRVEGDALDKDVYTVIAGAGDGPITGLRLEALPDGSRPGRGPGAADNGNFVLNELEVTAISVLDPGVSRRVTLRNAQGSFEQDGWGLAGAIDGQPGSGWAIMPRFGERHVLVAETTEDISFPGGTLLVATLKQQHGSQHVLGALRLSTTSSPRPIRHRVLSEMAMTALALPKSERTPEQAAALYREFVAARPGLQERVRLGAAQDLAWALVNSPSFLFNR
ncbi:DUF1549 and DUF1553 domain-containing protein [Planctomycetes bacterium Poly30]|uniref:DUF1553 domain-containing protein n=1 Tax=Saltatorellus ferox TaxID=2528018 RepID=UPI0011AAD48C